MTIEITRLALLLAFVSSLLPCRGYAQSSPPPDYASLRHALSRIAAEDPPAVRISSVRERRLQGRQLSVLGDTLFLTTDSGPRAIALTDVDSVWAQHGTAAGLFGIIA